MVLFLSPVTALDFFVIATLILPAHQMTKPQSVKARHQSQFKREKGAFTLTGMRHQKSSLLISTDEVERNHKITFGDILDIPIGSLQENEHSEELIILRDGRQFSDEVLTNDEWSSHLSLESIGSMLTKCMSSQTRFSPQIQAHLIL